MGSEDFEEIYDHFNVEVQFLVQGADCDVIHVVLPFLLPMLFVPRFQDGVHKLLKGCRGVTHSKEHNLGFEEPSLCFEGSFPLV